MRTIAVANAKGGTGKTTLAVNLAAGLAEQGGRVLLVDLDPQGNATSWLVGPLEDGAEGAAEGIVAEDLAPGLVRPSRTSPGPEVAPSTPAMAALDRALAGEPGGETQLRTALKRAARRYDFAVLDCPPAIGLPVISALVAADGIVAPVVASFLSLAGLRKLDGYADRTRERLGGRARVLGWLLFAADPRESITGAARDLMDRDAPGRRFDAEVRVSTAAKALPATGSTAWTPGADPRGRDDYARIRAEVLGRMTRR